MKAARLLPVIACLVCFSCAGQIVEYPESKPTTEKEIMAAIRGDDFRLKNAAREQLEKLDPAKRLELLTELARDEVASTRMIAVSELAKMPIDVVAPTLKQVAAEDSDPEVREFAAMLLEGGADPEPGCEGAECPEEEASDFDESTYDETVLDEE